MQPRQAAPAPRTEPLHYSVISTRAAERYTGLPPEARRVLRLCDGTRTLDALCEAAPGPATPRIVQRLESLGLIAALPPARRRRDTPTEVLRWVKSSAPEDSPIVAALEAAAPIVEKPTPVVEKPAPVVMKATPIVEPAPAPVVEKPAPVAAAPVADKSVAVEPAFSAPVEHAAPASTETAFSADEEAFFSTPLPDELPWDFDLR